MGTYINFEALLEKTAIDFGTTRKMLRALKSIGVSTKRKTNMVGGKYDPSPSAPAVEIGKLRPGFRDVLKNNGEGHLADLSPRSVLFHEAGHAMMHKDMGQDRFWKATNGIHTPQSRILQERLANDKAINFMRAHDTPSQFVNRYKQDLAEGYNTYRQHLLNTTKQRASWRAVAKNTAELTKADPSVSPKAIIDQARSGVDNLALMKDIVKRHRMIRSSPFSEPPGTIG